MGCRAYMNTCFILKDIGEHVFFLADYGFFGLNFIRWAQKGIKDQKLVLFLFG
jgi:hypothetical protein